MKMHFIKEMREAQNRVTPTAPHEPNALAFGTVRSESKAHLSDRFELFWLRIKVPGFLP
jgi:hypothetical protein